MNEGFNAAQNILSIGGCTTRRVDIGEPWVGKEG